MVTEAKRAANKRWNDAHKEQMRVYRYRSTVRNFIRNYATAKDIAEFRQLLDEREQLLSQQTDSSSNNH